MKLSQLLLGFFFLCYCFSSYSTNHNDLRIIYEDVHIEVQNTSGPDMSIQIRSKIKYFLPSVEAVKAIEDYSLPYNFDQTYRFHGPESRHLQSCFGDMKVTRFNAKKTQSEQEISLDERIEEFKMFQTNQRYGNFKRFHYKMVALEVGDTVEVDFAYDFPMRENWPEFQSYRVFFHSDIPKDYYKLSFSYPRKINCRAFEFNGAKADSIIEDKSHRVHQWVHKDLNGCLSELGARPYLELPYVVLRVKPIFFSYDVNNTLESKEIPSYAMLASMREYKHLPMVQAVDQGVKFKQFNLFYSFIKEHSSDSSLKRDYQQLGAVVNYMADEIKFKEDVKYYLEQDNFDPKFGTDLQEGRMRDINRYENYIGIIRKLDMGYFTAYIADKRFGVIDSRYLRPMYLDDYALAPLASDSQLHYILPKQSDFGLYMDEFPFYYENTRARLIHMKDYRSFGRDISTQLRQVQIPKSNFGENKRSSNIMAMVNTENGTINSKAMIKLSGQYSTLCRGSYLKNITDPTIHPDYGKKLWNESTDELIKLDIKKVDKTFPFNSVFMANYSSNQLFERRGSSLILKLDQIVTHISPTIDCSQKRELDYYPDFIGSDTYSYLLKFDKEVKLTEEKINVDLDNSYGQFVLSIEQLDAQTVKLSSFYAVKTRKLESAAFSNYCQIQSGMQSGLNQEIEIVINE